MKSTILFLLLFGFSNAYSQDTLILKISNLQNHYEPCFSHWISCETVLLGKLTSIHSDKTYTIHVLSPVDLNRLPKNASSIYQVVLRKRFSKGPFDGPGETYNLVDIRGAF